MNELPIILLRLYPFPAELPEYPVSGQAGMGLGPSGCCKVTRPCPVFRSWHHLRPDGVEDRITADLKKVGILLDQDGLEPALKQVAGPSVQLIEELGVDAVQLAHAQGQISVGRLDKEMVMIGG
jgi:hypothetical protein